MQIGSEAQTVSIQWVPELFPGANAAWSWSFQLTPVQCLGEEHVELNFYSSKCLRVQHWDTFLSYYTV
jgi:hypothetical protein